VTLYLISYDLRKERTSADYKLVHDRLRAFATYCWPLWSVWIIKSDATPKQILDYLVQSPGVDDNDGFIVMALTGGADWRRVDTKSTADWLNKFFIRY